MPIDVHHAHIMRTARKTAPLNCGVVIGVGWIIIWLRIHSYGYTTKMPEKSRKTIGLGILSWKSHDTLIKSLQSYPPEFLDSFDQKIIYFSDITDKDKSIATQYGWEYAGGVNEGIAGGMKRLAKTMTTDYILLLQNDNPLCDPADFAIDHIRKAVDMMDNGQADLARMRHRWKVGEGFADVSKYLKYYDVQNISADFIPNEHNAPNTAHAPLKKAIQRLLKPKNAKKFKGRSIFIEGKPENIYPNNIHRNGDFLIIDSAVLDFTDQCLLIARDKWLNVFVPFIEANPVSTRSSNGFQAPELCINKSRWWRDNHFKILQGQGCFTHARYDGSFRDNHWTKRN
jgi:hypothetical protein